LLCRSLELIKIIEYLNQYDIDIPLVLKKSNDVYMKTKQYIEESQLEEGCILLNCSDCLLSFFCTDGCILRCGSSFSDMPIHSVEICNTLEKLCDLYEIVNGELK